MHEYAIKDTSKGDDTPFLISDVKRTSLFPIMANLNFDILMSGSDLYEDSLYFVNSYSLKAMKVEESIQKFDLLTLKSETMIPTEDWPIVPTINPIVRVTKDNIFILGGHESPPSHRYCYNLPNMAVLTLNPPRWNYCQTEINWVKNSVALFNHRDLILSLNKNSSKSLNLISISTLNKDSIEETNINGSLMLKIVFL